MLKRAGFLCIIVISAALEAQSPPKIDDSSQPAVKALAEIARQIKECSRELSGERQWGKKKSEIVRWYIGPPMNVVWDVVPSTSVRSPYAGYIDFSLEYTQWIPEEVRDRYKDEFGLDYLLTSQGPIKHRYEFDVGPSGLELTRLLIRGKDGSSVDEHHDETCWQKAARNPSENVKPQHL